MKYKFTVNELRNLTTDRLHTDMGAVYTAMETILGETGIFTHQIPNASAAIKPWLRAHPQLQDARWWDGQFTTEEGTLDLELPTAEERREMWDRYATLPHPFAGKQVIAVQV